MVSQAFAGAQPQRGSRAWFANLIFEVRYRGRNLDAHELDGLEYEPSTAIALIRAYRPRPGRAIHLSGTITGDLRVGGTVTGNLWVSGTVTGNLRVGATVGGNLTVDGTVGGDLWVVGTVTGNLRVGGTVTGNLRVGATVGGNLTVVGTVTGNLWVGGTVTGNLRVGATVGGDMTILAVLGGMIAFQAARCRGRVVVTPREPSGGAVPLVSLMHAQFAAPVVIGDNVDISGCDFRRCPDLHQLRLIGGDLFPNEQQLSNPPRTWDPGNPATLITNSELASIYRQLRSNLQDQNNRAATALFYRGEMNARLAGARQRGWNLERVVLGAYQHLSGYGLSISKPLAWFAGVAVAGAAAFAVDGLDLDPNPKETVPASTMGTVTFAVRSMLSFLSPPDAELSTADLWAQIGLRFAGPILLTQFVLAVRERVAR
jgi:cytoskeletal protein CcmA (bactofilin family)